MPLCPKCKAAVTPGAAKCPSCGVGFVRKPAAVKPAAPAAPKSVAPKRVVGKPPSEADQMWGTDPTPRPAPVAPPVPQRRVSVRPRRNVVTTAGGIGIGGILLLGLIGLRICGTVAKVSRMSGQTVVDETFTIPADDSYAGIIEVDGDHTYTFEVTAIEGSVSMSFGRVSNPDRPTPQELMTLVTAARPVPTGRTETMMGGVKTGKYAWIVFNKNEKQSARAKIKFHGK